MVSYLDLLFLYFFGLCITYAFLYYVNEKPISPEYTIVIRVQSIFWPLNFTINIGVYTTKLLF